MKIRVADFTTTPGARYRKDGKFSGEEFREDKLRPIFDTTTSQIIVDLDGVEGYPTAFLEEVFGGLVRIYGISQVKSRIFVQATDEPALIDEVKKYMDNALNKRS